MTLFQNLCNQCYNPMKEPLDNVVRHGCCINPECPNFGLVQIPAEDMARHRSPSHP